MRQLFVVALLALVCGSELPALGQTGQDTPSGPQALAGETLIWHDEFTASSASAQPDAATWTFEQGGNGWGNRELETYCAFGAHTPPCDSAQPNAFVGRDGMLHLVARRTPDGQYTSARLNTQHHESFQYGRIEARIKIPSGQGMWPAFWLLGNDVDTTKWPACGELDVMENVGKEPGIVHGSIHGTGFTGTPISTTTTLPGGAPFAAEFHRYGMIWKPGSIAYYVDDPEHPYVVYTAADLPKGAVWPFDGRPFFILLNFAVGGAWPGNPDATSAFPAEMLVDYVRIWQRK